MLQSRYAAAVRGLCFFAPCPLTLDSVCTLFEQGLRLCAEHPWESLSQQQAVQQAWLGLEKILRSWGTRPERNHLL